MEEIEEKLKKAINDFDYFIKTIFKESYDDWIDAPHLDEWTNRVQNNKKTATLSARKHLKSTTMYALIMWKLLRCIDHSEKWMYMSYTEPMSHYHTQNIKQLIRRNPFFNGFKDLTQAEGIIKYTIDGKNVFSCVPAGILSFNRGWHGYGVICDDILADPENELNPAVIRKINTAFFVEVMSLPIEGGELHLVGTAQHQEDLFFTIKEKSPSFNWRMYKAILDEPNKKTLWPEMFNYERLIEIRDEEIGEKAFNKEYMCSPVWTEDAFFTRDKILKSINVNLRNSTYPDKTKFKKIIAGWDIGKHTHPSHFCVFVKENNKYQMIWEEFFDRADYNLQLRKVNQYVELLNIDALYYDATRGELEAFYEQGLMDRRVFKPVVFKVQTKHAMASNFEKIINEGRMELINDNRMINQILCVNNNLDAIETDEGHGDAFWSIAMALSEETIKTANPIAIGI